MKFLMQIYQGDALAVQSRLSQEETQQVWADYAALNQTAGVTPGERMASPETATTVRVQDGRTLATDGPYAEAKEALGGYFFLEADDLDAAVKLAATVPAARYGGAVEVRQLIES